MSRPSGLVERRAVEDGLDDRPLGPVFETTFAALGLPVHLLVVRGTPELLEDGRARVTELLGLWLGPANELRSVAGRRDATVTAETLLLADVASRPDPSEATSSRHGAPSRTLSSVDGVIVTLPAVSLADLSALAPALAADLVVRDLVDGGALGACARVGDDAAMLGVPPRIDGWRVEVPDGYGRTNQLLLAEGGVSSRGRWSGSRAATVTAPTAWQAARSAQRATDDGATGRAASTTRSAPE